VTERKRRVALYGAGIVLAGGLLFAGFGITIPPDPGTRLMGASMLAGLGDHDGALAICATVLEEHPDSLDARVYQASFLAQAKRWDESLQAYDDALEHVEGDSALLRSLRADRASVLLNAGRTADFRRERDDLARDNIDGHVHLLDGLKAQKDERWDAAVEAYRNAFAEDAKNVTAQALLYYAFVESGKAHLAERRFEQAKESFDGARELYPRVADTILLAVQVRLALDDAVDAVAVLRDSGVRAPGVAPLAFRAATALLRKQDFDASVAALQYAHDVDAEATKSLFDKESEWDAYRNRTVVAAVFETEDKSPEVGLTE